MPNLDTSSSFAPSDDNPARALEVARAEDDSLPHIGVVGNTYTILVAGRDTNGRFALIDMQIPSRGGPGLHRYDFEKTFIVTEGEITSLLGVGSRKPSDLRLDCRSLAAV